MSSLHPLKNFDSSSEANEPGVLIYPLLRMVSDSVQATASCVFGWERNLQFNPSTATTWKCDCGWPYRNSQGVLV